MDKQSLQKFTKIGVPGCIIIAICAPLAMFFMLALMVASCTFLADGEQWDTTRIKEDEKRGIVFDHINHGLKRYNADLGDTEYTIPDGVTYIADCAFRNCRFLESVKLPKETGVIHAFAFENCINLKKVTMAKEMGSVSVRDYAFKGCKSLSDVTMPPRVTEIGKGAFLDCKSLKNVTIPEGILVIKESTFEGCEDLENVTIPEGVTNIKREAFFGCNNLKNVTIPSSLKHIDFKAFSLFGCPYVAQFRQDHPELFK